MGCRFRPTRPWRAAPARWSRAGAGSSGRLLDVKGVVDVRQHLIPQRRRSLHGFDRQPLLAFRVGEAMAELQTDLGMLDIILEMDMEEFQIVFAETNLLHRGDIGRIERRQLAYQRDHDARTGYVHRP